MRSVKWVAIGLLAVGLQAPATSVTNAASVELRDVISARPIPGGTPGPDCGTRLKKPGGGFYTCTFVDGFDGSSLNTKYWYTMNEPGTRRSCSINDPRTVQVSGGSLRLSLRPTGDGVVCPLRDDGTRAAFASGAVNTYGLWSQQYGRFEARMKSPVVNGVGVQEAFWLWPDMRYSTDYNWPAAGEIDIAETYSAHPDLAIPFLHYSADDNGGPVPGLNTAWDCAARRGDWHTYTLDWSAQAVTISVDGQTCLTNTAGSSSFQKRFIMAFSMLLGEAGVNTFDGTASLPATLEVDYVKVWQ